MGIRRRRRWRHRSVNRARRLSVQRSLHRNQHKTGEKLATNVSHSSAFSVCRSVRRGSSAFHHNTECLQRCFGQINCEDSLAFTCLIKIDSSAMFLRNLLSESQSESNSALPALTHKRQKYLLA